MKYLVIFKEDSGRMHVKNKIFYGLLEAETYAATIDRSREPVIVPYLPMSSEKGEFNANDHDVMAKMLEELRCLFLFSYEDAGCAPMASHHVIQAYNHMSNAVQALHMAALIQARETHHG